MMLLPTKREEELLALIESGNLTEEEQEKIDQELIEIGKEQKDDIFE